MLRSWLPLWLLLVAALCNGQNAGQNQPREEDKLTTLLKEVRLLRRSQEAADKRVMEKLAKMDSRLDNVTRNVNDLIDRSSSNRKGKENLALLKPTSQSSTVFCGHSKNAVDGSTEGNYSRGSCTQTQNGKQNFWFVDLRRPVAIDSVTIWNRRDCCTGRMRNLEVFVSLDKPVKGKRHKSAVRCGVLKRPLRSRQFSFTVSCDGQPGRFVSIVKKVGVLTLCEVQVFQAEPGPPLWTYNFKKLQMKESSFNAITEDNTFTGVRTLVRCYALCHRSIDCYAVFYNETQGLCRTLTDQRTHVEPTGRPVSVWVKSNSNLGKCAPSYNFRWENSRYRWMKSRKTWSSAKKWCSYNGGKLAELTSKREFDSIGPRIAKENHYVLVGGMQRKGATEPAGDWKWQISDMAIPSDGFQWCQSEPNNYRGMNEVVLSVHKNGSACFNDFPGTNKGTSFLCECVQFNS